MKKRRGIAARGPGRKPNHQARRAAFEQFEDRLLLATVFTVTSLADTPRTVVANDGTLRGEILAANAAMAANGPFSIDFAVSGTIKLSAILPAITQSNTTIDGTSAPGFTATPVVVIDGTNSGNNAGSGSLTASVPFVTFRDLVINNFTGDGIQLNGGFDTVDGCWIGTDATGTGLAGNTGAGILASSTFNTIGDLTTNPNVISGNSIGVLIMGTSNQASFNTIQHNYIGTDATGTLSLGNTTYGIDAEGGFATIGGTSTNGPGGPAGPAGLGNLISGNTLGGLKIAGQGSNTNVTGNYIGTDVSGLNKIPNGFFGISVSAVNTILIGGVNPGTGNVISGNNGDGVDVTNTATQNVRLQGNSIGVAVGGILPLGNRDIGVFINSANAVTVGGTSLVITPPFSDMNLAFANIIAYNGAGKPGGYGVEVLGGVNNGILTNSIFANGGPGIKLNLGGNQGITPPILTKVESAGQTRITGTYAGIPNTQYRIQFFSNKVPNSTGTFDGQTFLGEINITTNNQGNATFTTTLNVAVQPGVPVTATATQQPLQINNTSQFSQSVATTQAATTDLEVETSPTSPLNPLLNQPFTFTITVSNNGPDPSTNVILTDTIPTNSTFITSNIPPAQGGFTNGVVTDNLGTLAPGASVIVTITVNPSSTAGAFTNTAVVAGDALETKPINNTSITTGTVANSADLTVFLTPSAPIVPVGSPISYTLTVGNNGPSTTSDTTVTISLPASYTSISVSPDQGTATPPDGNNTVTVNLGILPGSSSSTILITATPTAIGTQLVTATVSSSTEDPNPANNTTTVPVVVANAADLALTVAASPDPVVIPQELFYTLIVTNNGPSSATAPVLYDALDPTVTFDPANSSAGIGGSFSFVNGLVIVTLGAPLASGDSQTVTIAVFPTVSGQITNFATVGDPDEVHPIELDPDLTNNSVTTTTQVSPADVGVTVLNPADPLFIGTQAVYQILVTNNGPASAGNVSLVNTFSPGATIVSTSAGTISGSTVTANLGTLANGASMTITIVVNPTASVTLTNMATVTSSQFDPDSNNNTSSSSNLVSPVDLAVAVAGSPNPTLTGHPLTYVVTVTNSGPAVATNVLLNDLLPAGSIFVSATPSQGAVALASATTLTGNLGSLAPGATATVTIIVTPTVVATAVNTASITSDNLDTNTVNNTASAAVSVVNLPGTFQFDTPLVFVPENAGSVSITIDRVNGSLGVVTVDYATSDGTAVDGVNYVGSMGTITFLDGQTSATITIPVLDDLKINGNNGFFITLSNPTGNASIGTDNIESVVVTNTDRDMIPPVVTGLIAIPNGSSINGFVITFDKAMDPYRASLLANYHIFVTNGGSGQTPVPLAAALYDPANNSVTLVPTSPLPSNRFYHIIANGSVGPVLTDLSGNTLFGSAGVGTNYDVFYGQGNHLRYNDAQGNAVAINLTNGGTLGIFLDSHGEAAAVNLFGIVPRKSKLTGSVTKLNKAASGRTYIDQIIGFGNFGDVNSALTTPPFYAGYAPVIATGTGDSVGATSLPVNTTSIVLTTVKKKTPKGPQSLRN